MSLLLARRRPLLFPSAAAAADYATVVAADSPTAWWRFEETTGSTAADEIGTNDGTVYGANLATASFATTGSAASFDGTDDYIQVPHNSVLNAGNLFTFECLAKCDTPTANDLQLIADKTAASQNNGQWALWWDNRSTQGSPQRLRFRNTSVGGGNLDRLQADYEGSDAADAIAAGIHVVGTFDHAADISVRLYVNGTEVATSTAGTINPPDATNTLNLQIARLGTAFYFGGILDELAIYDKALTPARILAHAQAAGVA